MLKFVKQGESGRGLGEEWPAVSVVAAPEHKDGDHDCTVCRTRRRSLDRQAAGVLRRSRSRETLRSIGNTSSNEDDTCISKHSKMSQDDNGKQVEGGGGRVWRAKGDKYRRLSRSCEALSMSNKGARWRQGDMVDEIEPTRDALPSRMRAGQTVESGKSPLSQDVKRNKIRSSISGNGRMPCSPTVPTECKTRQLGEKESKYAHDQRWQSPMDKDKSDQRRGSVSGGKQVQFGGVEYEKSKEESVIGKLRNAVSGNRRKLRSRSLERVDRRCEWNPELRGSRDSKDSKDSWTEGNGRSRSKSWARDESIHHPVTSCERGIDRAAYEHQQLLKNCKRRSRSRSKECVDRTDGSETRQGKEHVYRCDDNQNVILTPAASWQNENFTKTRSSSSNHHKVLSDATFCTDGRTNDLQYKSPSRTDNHESASREFERTFQPQRRDKTCTLISPQYKAPNGHYGSAVVRKCHKEQKHANNKEQTSRNAHSNSPKFENASRKGDAVMPSEQGSNQKTRQHGRDNTRRSSAPKLEKCGISATKIAKLDTPLKMMTPDPSIINKIVDAPTVFIISNKDAASTSQQNTETLSAISSSDESRKENCTDSTVDNESCSSGYVYNCTTSKITKLSKPETNTNFEQPNSKLIPQIQTDVHISSITKEKLSPSQNKTDQVVCPKEIRKSEAANNLVRQASVASLSLISVNSVDSGTSCHEGSTTDSSSSSDKEMETQGNTSKQRLGREARQYTASARELENLILASCFGKDKHLAGPITSDYESDTGPEMVRNQTTQDGRRRGGVSRVVRFVGSKDDIDVNRDMKRNQQSKPKGQAQNSSKKSAANIKPRYPEHSISNHLRAKLTARARVLHNHKAMSKAEMSVQKGDVVYLTPEDFEQRPLWVRAYLSCSGETGLIPSVYLGTN